MKQLTTPSQSQQVQQSPLLSAFLAFGLIVLAVYVFVVGKSILLPLVIAVFLWFLINALASGLVKAKVPQGLSTLVATLLLIAGLVLIIELIATNLVNMTGSLPDLETGVNGLLQNASAKVGLKELPSFANFQHLTSYAVTAAGEIGSGLSATAGFVFTVAIYVMFLLAEQHSFAPKLAGYFVDEQRLAKARQVIDTIAGKIQSYIKNKTLISLLVGAVSYVIMKIAGLEYAEFWAVVIFLFNYIPVIGALIATLLPAVFALVQFPTLTTPIVMVLALCAGHFVIGNVLEPRIMGKSLNLSPLVIILSLAFWGSVWGVVGMLLSIPITVGIMVVCAQQPATRRFAVLLSESGHPE